MAEFVKLSVGETYPKRFSKNQEGAIAEFLRVNNTLIINMPNINQNEVKSFKKGYLTCGLLAKNGAILFIWQFNDQKGRPVLTLDSPFDARIIPDIDLHDVTTSETRLAIDINVIDTATNIVKALRLVTMPPELTLSFLSAVQDQLVSISNGELQHQQWMQTTPAELLLSTTAHKMGT